ncbi:MAG TPA: 6-carboxytetrahydropterin synthase [Planctomycetota bacterium]|nr:6-carboxytetrahydropterin synthase [Planctomycetota bacterium]
MHRVLTLTRKVTFFAGHVYRGGGLSREELEDVFGVAAEPGGHGHNYVLELSVRGPVDPIDGMVINIKTVDAELKCLLGEIDHRMLNSALPEFADAVPTTERLAQVLWARIPEKIGAARKVSLRLEEHPGMHVEIFEENPAMVHLTRSIEFSAAHRLHSEKLSEEENWRVYGKCNNPSGHGHNYVVEVTVRGEPDARTGIVIDIGKFDALLDEEIDARFDHKHLNLDTTFFKDVPATAENIAIVIWNLLEKKIAALRSGVALHRVRLIETARSWFDYYGK